jgi:hypothetical protein
MGEEGEGEVSACGVASEDDVLGEFVQGVEDVREDGGGLLELAGVFGYWGEVWSY